MFNSIPLSGNLYPWDWKFTVDHYMYHTSHEGKQTVSSYLLTMEPWVKQDLEGQFLHHYLKLFWFCYGNTEILLLRSQTIENNV